MTKLRGTCCIAVQFLVLRTRRGIFLCHQASCRVSNDIVGCAIFFFFFSCVSDAVVLAGVEVVGMAQS